jgi:hypothetical protein
VLIVHHYYTSSWCIILLGGLRPVIKEAKEQHYCRLIAKSDNKIKTTWNIVKRETGKIHLALLINSEKVKDPVTIANAFNIFFLTITEGLKLQVRNEDPISFLEDAFPVKFCDIKIIPTTETDNKYSTFPQIKKLIRLL